VWNILDWTQDAAASGAKDSSVIDAPAAPSRTSYAETNGARISSLPRCDRALRLPRQAAGNVDRQAIEQIARRPDGCPARRSSTDLSRPLLRTQTRAGRDRGEPTSPWAAKRR
jgi:hypothetical protein